MPGQNVKKGDTVTIHYTGKFEDHEIFDSSKGRDPLQFIVGEGQIIVGVEKAVMGMHPGESKTVKINPSEAYGERRDDLVSQVEKKHLSPEMDAKPGTQWLIGDPEDPTIVTVVDIDDTLVTLDANHPLAGKMLIFDLELVAIA